MILSVRLSILPGPLVAYHNESACSMCGDNASALSNNAETTTLTLTPARRAHSHSCSAIPVSDPQESRNLFPILDIPNVDARNLGKMKARWGVSVPQLDNNDERFKSQQCEYLTNALGVWP